MDIHLILLFLLAHYSFVPVQCGLIPSSHNTSIESRDSGNHPDGRWHCPSRDWGKCRDGEMTCTKTASHCPGGGRGLFTINCKSNGFLDTECGDPVRTYYCDRYDKCDECRSSQIGENSRAACLSCIAGFIIGPGDCTTDLDECATDVDGCEHCCTNTYGSYYCDCRQGYRLRSDKHTCDRLNCGHPGHFHQHGIVSHTDSWNQHSYATFDCDVPFVLRGPFHKKCVGLQGAAGVGVTGWEDHVPTCVDRCDVSSLHEQTLCGWDKIDGKSCKNLGCCFHIATMTCRQKPGNTYTRYAGEKSTYSPIATIDRALQQSCAYECDINPNCKSYMMQREALSDGFVNQWCHLLDISRTDLLDQGHLAPDSNHDMYQIIVLNSIGDSPEETEKRSLDKLYEGCYNDSGARRDLPFHVETSAQSMSVSRCVDICRSQTFTFAGIQNGVDCFCGNTMMRRLGETNDCNIPCPGDGSQICGGPHSNAIYHVNIDHRYIGCYNDSNNDRDFPVYVTGGDNPLTVAECITECSNRRYRYAGLQAGGDCYCGDTYGKHGGAKEMYCHMPCGLHDRQNCGGDMVNAVYLTELAFDITQSIEKSATKIYNVGDNILNVDPKIFSIYTGLRSFISPKLVIHSHTDISIMQKDPACAVDCYTDCGNIANPSGFTNVGDDVILRFLHFRLSDLHNYVGLSPKRVYVYAQTVVIDADVDVSYSLLIRARQILLDRYKTRLIQVSGSAPDLGVDIQNAKNQGPFPDLMHQKQSYMCARILLETKTTDNSNRAFAIINEIASSPSETEEQASFAGVTRAFATYMSGINRADVHFVPAYTKSYLADTLDDYFYQIRDYFLEMEKLEDVTNTHDQFVKIVENMANIYFQTNLEVTKIMFDKTIEDIEGSLAVYIKMEQNYNASHESLLRAEFEFEQGIIQHQNEQMRKGLGGLIKSVGSTLKGLLDMDLEIALKGIMDIFETTTGMAETFQEIRLMVNTMHHLTSNAMVTLAKLKDLNSYFDTAEHIENIEEMTAIEASIEQWDSMKEHADVILHDGEVKSIYGALEYARALMDSANWGEGLSQAMLERAELTRNAIEKRASYEAKLNQQRRIQQLIDDLRVNIGLKEAALAAMHEQTYDVRCDLNEALLQFCQAYFYENHRECSPEVKPAFGEELIDLLLKILAARNDDLLIEKPPSTIHTIVKIRDLDTSGNCNDAHLCPITYLRNHRVLVYTLPPDHPEFAELHKCRLAELRVTVPGATPSGGGNNMLEFTIQAAGRFYGRYGPDTFTFITRPINVIYKYNVITNEIDIPAIIYDHNSNKHSHVTPYASWVMTINDGATPIDLHDVTEVHLGVLGSGLVMYMDQTSGKMVANISTSQTLLQPRIPLDVYQQQKEQLLLYKPLLNMD